MKINNLLFKPIFKQNAKTKSYCALSKKSRSLCLWRMADRDHTHLWVRDTALWKIYSYFLRHGRNEDIFILKGKLWNNNKYYYFPFGEKLIIRLNLWILKFNICWIKIYFSEMPDVKARSFRRVWVIRFFFEWSFSGNLSGW